MLSGCYQTNRTALNESKMTAVNATDGAPPQPPAAHTTPVTVTKTNLTLEDTCALFSCRFMMASEIFTSMGSTTDSMLKGPSSRFARFFRASATIKMAHLLRTISWNNSTVFQILLGLCRHECHGQGDISTVFSTFGVMTLWGQVNVIRQYRELTVFPVYRTGCFDVIYSLSCWLNAKTTN